MQGTFHRIVSVYPATHNAPYAATIQPNVRHVQKTISFNRTQAHATQLVAIVHISLTLKPINVYFNAQMDIMAILSQTYALDVQKIVLCAIKCSCSYHKYSCFLIIVLLMCYSVLLAELNLCKRL